jgi:hypothetical protein
VRRTREQHATHKSWRPIRPSNASGEIVEIPGVCACRERERRKRGPVNALSVTTAMRFVSSRSVSSDRKGANVFGETAVIRLLDRPLQHKTNKYKTPPGHDSEKHARAEVPWKQSWRADSGVFGVVVLVDRMTPWAVASKQRHGRDSACRSRW